MADLLVKLYDLPPSAPVLEKLRAAGVDEADRTGWVGKAQPR